MIKEAPPETTPRSELVEQAWIWYREWATIARVAIPRKDLRINLGISRRSESGEEIIEADLDEATDPAQPGNGTNAGTGSSSSSSAGTGAAAQG